MPVCWFVQSVLGLTDTPEETLHYDGPNDDALGLTRGGNFWCAARFTPVLPCSLKAILFYHADLSHDGAVYVYGQNNDTVPGAILDSAPYSGTGTPVWRRVDLAHPLALQPDADFWAAVRCVHDSDYFPMGIDAGPMVRNRGGFFSLNGNTWVQLNRLGMNVNANIRAIVRMSALTQDVGVKRIVTPRGFVADTLVTPVMTVKNFGTGTATGFTVRLTILPDGYTSVRMVNQLAPGDTVRVVFDNWRPAGGGYCSVSCSTELSGDENPANDRIADLALVPEFTETFEANNGGYVAECYPSPGWVWGTPASPRPAPRSGTKVWGAPLSGNYPDMADWSLYSRVYLAARDSPAIAFYHWYNAELGIDGGNLCYSLDTGRTWNLICPWTDYSLPYDQFVHGLNTAGYTGTSGLGWRNALFRIPVLAGTPFQLRWLFASDGSTTGPGWTIDDFSGIGVVPPADVAEQAPARTGVLSLSIAPSHTGGATDVRFTLARQGQLRLALYDASGRLVLNLVRGGYAAGSHSLPLDCTGLTAGCYLLLLRTENSTAGARLVVR